MAENRIWGPTERAQQTAIEVVLRNRQLAESRRQFDAQMAATHAERNQKDQQEFMKIVDAAQKAKIDYAKDMMKTAYEKGDTTGMQTFGAPLQEQGFPVPGQALPQDQDKSPTSIGGALARLYADNPKKLSELFAAQHQKSGMRLEVDKEGNIKLLQGSGIDPALELQKTQKGKIQEKAMDAAGGLKRMEGIVKSFNPEFLKIPGKIGAEWTAVKEKLNLGQVSEEDQKFLEDYSIFKQNALENINLYNKEITGAQMSEKEASRIRKAVPDPGEGIIGGDSPTQFRAKLINVYRKNKAALARYNYYLKLGIPEQKVKDMVNSNAVMPLDDVEKMLEDRATQIKNENPSATMKQIANQIRQEFGL